MYNMRVCIRSRSCHPNLSFVTRASRHVHPSEYDSLAQDHLPHSKLSKLTPSYSFSNVIVSGVIHGFSGKGSSQAVDIGELSIYPHQISSLDSFRLNGSVVPVLKVDRTGLAGGCGHYTDVSRPPRTPLSHISNYSCLSREQEYLGGSRLKATLQAPNVVTDENGQFRSKVRRCNKDRRALRPLTINLENVVDFDDDVPLSDILSGLRTDRVRLKTLKRKGTFVVDEIKKKLNFGPAISELPPHNVVGYEDIG
ncbi:hypothetical protein DCAR_0520061 [Daucus carota subsp. sativus]|uniref:Uncharacterized protein n=1 Tax=Daucus carota subsp. sativus TaxID=79200 RepID=A0A175YEF1_DAUCS|nr:hypothetical protein DCAR_0520061 [Daucus carota subsp. sativus]